MTTRASQRVAHDFHLGEVVPVFGVRGIEEPRGQDFRRPLVPLGPPGADEATASSASCRPAST